MNYWRHPCLCHIIYKGVPVQNNNECQSIYPHTMTNGQCCYFDEKWKSGACLNLRFFCLNRREIDSAGKVLWVPSMSSHSCLQPCFILCPTFISLSVPQPSICNHITSIPFSCFSAFTESSLSFSLDPLFLNAGQRSSVLSLEFLINTTTHNSTWLCIKVQGMLGRGLQDGVQGTRVCACKMKILKWSNDKTSEPSRLDFRLSRSCWDAFFTWIYEQMNYKQIIFAEIQHMDTPSKKFAFLLLLHCAGYSYPLVKMLLSFYVQHFYVHQGQSNDLCYAK